MAGKVSWTSATRISTASTRPPAYPASKPTNIPTTIENATADNPMVRLMRPP